MFPDTVDFSSSNTDGSFTTAVSNSFLNPKENPLAADLDFPLYHENGILYMLISIASMRGCESGMALIE